MALQSEASPEEEKRENARSFPLKHLRAEITF